MMRMIGCHIKGGACFGMTILCSLFMVQTADSQQLPGYSDHVRQVQSEYAKSNNQAEAALISLYNQARMALDQERYPQAEILAEQAYQQSFDVFAPGDPRLISVPMLLGNIYIARQKLPQALSVYQEALSLQQRMTSTADISLLPILSMITKLQDRLALSQQALPSYQLLLSLQQHHQVKQDLQIPTLVRLGDLTQQISPQKRGEIRRYYEKAYQFLFDIISRNRKSEESERAQLVSLAQKLGNMYRQEQRKRDEKEILAKTIERIQTGVAERDLLIHPLLSRLASLAEDEKAFAKAEILQKQALKILEAVFDPTDPRLAPGLYRMARLFGDLPEAFTYYQRALAAYLAAPQGHEATIVKIIQRIIPSLLQKGAHEEVVAALRQSITYQEMLRQSKPENETISYRLMSESYQALGNVEEALLALQRAVRIGESHLSGHDDGVEQLIDMYQQIGDMEYDLGDAGAAIDSYDIAIGYIEELRQKRPNRKTLQLTQLMQTMADALRDIGQVREANRVEQTAQALLSGLNK